MSYDFTEYSLNDAAHVFKWAANQYRENNDLERDVDVPFTESDVEDALNNIDIQKLKDEERSKWSIEVYDGGSWRGASEEEMMNRVTGEVGYIIDGEEPRKTYFQPFIPFVGGKKPLKSSNWKSVAEAHLDRLVLRKVAPVLAGKILEKV